MHDQFSFLGPRILNRRASLSGYTTRAKFSMYVGWSIDVAAGRTYGNELPIPRHRLKKTHGQKEYRSFRDGKFEEHSMNRDWSVLVAGVSPFLVEKFLRSSRQEEIWNFGILAREQI